MRLAVSKLHRERERYRADAIGRLMEEDSKLLARVLEQRALLEDVLLNDALEDWNLAKDLGEFLVRMLPEDIVGHALLVRACRHTGDIKRAVEELTVCR